MDECAAKKEQVDSNNLEKISSASAIRNGIKENKDISIAVPNITLNYLDDIVFIDDFSAKAPH